MKCVDFPRAIEIQTISACNAKCTVCPHPQVSRDLPSGLMDMPLFCRIIDQIDSVWRCRIIPYLNNEPLLDPLIVERLRYVVSKFDNPEIELSTNVSALDPIKQAGLVGIPLAELRLSVFGFTETSHRNAMPGLRWAVVKQNLDYLVGNKALRHGIQRISIVMVDAPGLAEQDVQLAKCYCEEHDLEFNFWGFLDRAGNVQRYSNAIYRTRIVGCEQNRPLERMHISHTGGVILCCQDWRWYNVIGNAKEQGLLDIWHSDAYNRYRRAIYAGKGEQPDVCSRCKLSIPAG